MMEYSPMMVVMLWALTPSDASSAAAYVQEVPTPPMTVHQESYFTFNHGKPFLAEQDPLTGAILNLKTTPVLADDYAYEEEEDEPDGIDRKDGPKVYTRNDIIQPSKDPDLHKFLNLPVHYSTSGKFPLISSSYANTKVQGHSANTHSNHRLTPTSSTTTVSPSYYPLKTSPTTAPTTTTTTTTTTTSTTTTTTPKPTTTAMRFTTTRTTTTAKPPPSYEYEYEYDYDHEPENDKKTTTQKILDFFEKDYAFLGASEEERNTTKVEYVMPSSPEKSQKEKETMISPNSNLFIPGDYLKPNSLEKINENKTNSTYNDRKEAILPENSTELKKTTNETSLVNSETYSVMNTTNNDNDNEKHTFDKELEKEKEKEKTEEPIQFVTTTKIEIETTTPKMESSSTKTPMKDQKIPFFPTLPSDLRENIFGISNKPTETATKSTQDVRDNKPSEMPSTHAIKPVPFHPTSIYQVHESQPQDSLPQPTRPTENKKPYNPYQRPYLTNSDVPPEMLPPVRPSGTTYHQRPQERPSSDSYTHRPIDSFHHAQNRPVNNRPMETIGNQPPNDHHLLRPHSEMRPFESQPTAASSQTQRPTDTRPHENMQRPDVKISNRPIMPELPSNHPTESAISHHNKPYEVVPPYRPEYPHVNPTDNVLLNRPQEMPQKPVTQRPLGRPDERYPPYNPIRHQEMKPEQRPQQIPEYRPLGARPEEQRPQNIKPEQRPQHIPQYRPLGPRPEESRPQEIKPESRPQHIPEYRPIAPRPEETRPSGIQEFSVGLGTRIPDVNSNRQENPAFNNNKYQVQFTQPSKVENHFIKVSPGQENPSYSLQTSFSIGVPPPDEVEGQGSVISASVGSTGNKGVGQVLFPDEAEKRPWAHQEEKRPTPPVSEAEKYPRPPWESHLKPPLVFNHLKKEPFLHKRPKPARPDLPNILPQFRPNAKIGHAEPHVYLKTPLDTLQPPPLPRPQFLRAEPPIPDEEMPIHRRNGQTTRVVPIQPIIPNPKRGSLRSEDEKTDPVFVVYPSNNAQDGVVVGTRGPQRPLPPDNLDIEDSFPLDNNKNFQARVDTPILKVKPTKPVIKNEFPYPLIKPTEVEEKPSTTGIKEYTAFSPTVPPTEKEHDTEINIIPYLQDYMPFATKKPTQDPPKWNVGDDIKPISVTLKTQKTEETTAKIDNHKSEESPTPQDFQAPFHASLSAPNQGWSVVRPRPEPEKEEETTTIKAVEEEKGKFDIQNFKPQLFGGFKPIIPPIEDKEPIKHDKENI